ncbi:MAG: sel1 repeat family protein, partial [Rhodospirillales bacterium]|nr:sel1 repeat family protein [Rhodospirillales bacterium]
MMKTLRLAAVLCLLGGASAWADGDAAARAMQQHDYASALREWRPVAEQGDAAAQYNMGVIHYNGLGIERDIPAAIQWFEKAAAGDNVPAMSLLGALYLSGQAGKSDPGRTFRLLLDAAKKGDATAQYNVGSLYASGQGVPVNLVQAWVWVSAAERNGVIEAQELRKTIHARLGEDDKEHLNRLA